MKISKIWPKFVPKELAEITNFLDKILNNNPDDLEVAMKSRKKVIEIQNVILENNFIFSDFEDFLSDEKEKFFTENTIIDEKNREIIENFFEERFLDMKQYIREREIIFWQQKICDIIMSLLPWKAKK